MKYENNDLTKKIIEKFISNYHKMNIKCELCRGKNWKYPIGIVSVDLVQVLNLVKCVSIKTLDSNKILQPSQGSIMYIPIICSKCGNTKFFQPYEEIEELKKELKNKLREEHVEQIFKERMNEMEEENLSKIIKE